MLQALGVDSDLAFGYTIVLHAALWFPITALGGWYMWREGVKWRDFERVKETAVADAPAGLPGRSIQRREHEEHRRHRHRLCGPGHRHLLCRPGQPGHLHRHRRAQDPDPARGRRADLRTGPRRGDPAQRGRRAALASPLPTRKGCATPSSSSSPSARHRAWTARPTCSTCAWRPRPSPRRWIIR